MPAKNKTATTTKKSVKDTDTKKSTKEATKKKQPLVAATVLPDGIAVKYIPLIKLESQTLAPREELKNLAKLKRSVRNVGIREPLIVRPIKDSPNYEVINGNRRLEVLKSLEVETAPCIILNLDAEAMLSHIFVTNTQQVKLANVDMVYIASTLAEAVGNDEAAKLLSMTPKGLEHLLTPKDTKTGAGVTAAGQPKETSVLLDTNQTKAYISGKNTTAIFGKAVANKGDSITIVGVLGKGKVTSVKEVKDGVQLTWTLVNTQ